MIAADFPIARRVLFEKFDGKKLSNLSKIPAGFTDDVLPVVFSFDPRVLH